MRFSIKVGLSVTIPVSKLITGHQAASLAAIDSRPYTTGDPGDTLKAPLHRPSQLLTECTDRSSMEAT